jgi:hypothetical protein
VEGEGGRGWSGVVIGESIGYVLLLWEYFNIRSNIGLCVHV